jgi:putative tryptophan/tyrosine transport system substrate-binding protein
MLCAAAELRWDHCMKRREFIVVIGGAAVAWPGFASAQGPARSRLLGVLVPATQSEGQQLASSLRRQLEKFGWSEALGFRIADRWSSFDADRLQSDVADLLRLNPDVILVSSTQALSALLRASPTAPIVFVNVGNPVERGFIQSLARPGNNITGFANDEDGLGGKRLEVLKQIVPNLSQVLVIGSRGNPAWPEQLGRLGEQANTFQLRLTSFDADDNDELERAARSLAPGSGGGMYVLPSIYSWKNKEPIIAIAARCRLPAAYPSRAFVVSGGLMTYTFDAGDQWPRAVSYINRILRGAKAGTLPVQQSTKFELMINLKTAKSLGLTVPPTLLALADEVIE